MLLTRPGLFLTLVLLTACSQRSVRTPAPSPVYLAGPAAELPTTCPPDRLTFYAATDTHDLYQCLAPGPWRMVKSDPLMSYTTPPPPWTAGMNVIAPPVPPVTCAGVNQPNSDQLHYGSVICQNVPQPPDIQRNTTAYTDPAFGGRMEPITTLGQTWTHGYSLPTPISAHNRWVNVTYSSGVHYALDLRGGGAVHEIEATSSAVIWDAVDDDSYYFLRQNSVVKHSMATRQNTIVADYAGRFTRINNGGSTHLSTDNWMSFWAEDEHQICALDTTHGKTYCADYRAPEAISHINWDWFDFSIITDIDSGTGKRYVALVATPALGIWTVNESAGKLDFATRGPEMTTAQGFNDQNGNQDMICNPTENCLSAPHLDVTAYGGKQYFLTAMDVSTKGCGRILMLFPIADLGLMVEHRLNILPMSYCSSAYEWPEIHYGCTLKTGACIISTETNTPSPYGNQLLLMRDPQHVTRMAYHYSRKIGSDTYWYFARAGISLDGTMIVFDSNWMRPDEGNGTAHEQVFTMRTQ